MMTTSCALMQPIGLRWFYTSYSARRMNTELPIPQDDVSDDIQKEWQDARANRIMQFKVADFQDSNIRMLTGTLKADWIQLPVERYLAALSTLKQGGLRGRTSHIAAVYW